MGIGDTKFENMWLQANGFVDKVRRWSSYQFTGTPSFILARKLKALKFNLKEWNAEVFGNINGQKNPLMEELQVLEYGEEDGALSKEAFLKKNQWWLT